MGSMTVEKKNGAGWKTPEFTADSLKLFACLTMLLQTVGVAVIGRGMIHIERYTQAGLAQALEADSHLMTLAGISSGLELLGGLSVPLFAFLLVEGFRNTSDYRRYLLTMVGFALLSEVPYDLAMQQEWLEFSAQNALISMSVCLGMLGLLRLAGERGKTFATVLQLLVILAALAAVMGLRSAYGGCLVLLTAIFYLLYAKNGMKMLLGIAVSLFALYITGPLAFYGIYCYNGQRKNQLPKYAYYVFYPLHLLVIGLIVKLGMAG